MLEKKHLIDPNTLIECSNTMDDVYGDIDKYNPNRKRKILIAFDDMVAGIKPNKKFHAIINEVFIRHRKINTSLVFIAQSYFSVSKDAKIKFITLFDYENKQQKRITKYCN